MSESAARPTESADAVPSVEKITRAIKAVQDELDGLVSTASPRIVPLTMWANLGTLKGQLEGADDEKRKKIGESLVAFGTYINDERSKIARASLPVGADATAAQRKVSELTAATPEVRTETLRYADNATLATLLTNYGPANMPNIGSSYVGEGLAIPAFGKKWTLTPFHRSLIEEYNARNKDRTSGRIKLENFRAMQDKNGNYVVGHSGDSLKVIQSGSAGWYRIQKQDGSLTRKEYPQSELDDALEAAWLKVDKKGDALVFNKGVDDVAAVEDKNEDPRDARIRALEERLARYEAGGVRTDAQVAGAAAASETPAPVIAPLTPPAVPHVESPHHADAAAHGEVTGPLDAHALKKQHVMDAMLHGFGKKVGIDTRNPELFNGLRTAEVAASLEQLRGQGKWGRMFRTFARGIIPTLAAVAAGAAAVAFLGPLVLGMAGLSGLTGISAAVLGKVAVGAMAGAPTALAVRGLMQHGANKRYGVGTNWKNAFVPFYRNKNEKGEVDGTVLTADAMRDIAGSGNRVEKKLSPHFKYLAALEKKNGTAQSAYNTWVAKVGEGAVPISVRNNLAAAQSAVQKQQARLANFSELGKLQNKKGGRLNVAEEQRIGERNSKWKRMGGTLLSGAVAGGVGGVAREFITTAVAMPVAPGGGTETVLPVVPDSRRADGLPVDLFAGRLAALPPDLNNPAAVAMRAEIIDLNTRIRAGGVNVDALRAQVATLQSDYDALRSRGSGRAPLVEPRPASAPTGAEMADRMKAKLSVSADGVQGGPKLSAADVYWNANKSRMIDMMHLSSTDCEEGTVASIQEVLAKYGIKDLPNNHRLVALLDYYMDPQGKAIAGNGVPSARQLLTNMGANPADATRIRNGLKMEHLFGNRAVTADLVARLERQLSPRELTQLMGTDRAPGPLRKLFGDAQMLVAKSR
jgi:hypothetical protein